MDNILTLNINSTAFDKMKEDFNKVLKKTLSNMLEKQSEEATLNLKLKILIEEVRVRDYDAISESATKTINKPSFEHKLSSVMQIKTQESGSLKGEYELVWDENLQEFVMKPITNGQTSFFDADYTVITPNDEEDEECSYIQIEGSSMRALPQSCEDEVNNE